MILVTVGTHNHPFDRLVVAADLMAAEIEELSIIQRGPSNHTPLFAEHFRFTSSSKMEELTSEARVVITHAAVGAIILALKLQKPTVVVPRLRHFGEATDDHQLQIAKILEIEGKVVLLDTPTATSLLNAMNSAVILKWHMKGPHKLINTIRQQLRLWQYSGLNETTENTQR